MGPVTGAAWIITWTFPDVYLKLQPPKQHRVFLDNVSMCACNMCTQTMHPHRRLDSRIVTAAAWAAGSSPEPHCPCPARCQLSGSQERCCRCLSTQTWPGCHHVCHSGTTDTLHRAGRPAKTRGKGTTAGLGEGTGVLPEEGTLTEEKEWVTSTQFPEKSTAVGVLFWTNPTSSKRQWIVLGSFIPTKIVCSWVGATQTWSILYANLGIRNPHFIKPR